MFFYEFANEQLNNLKKRNLSVSRNNFEFCLNYFLFKLIEMEMGWRCGIACRQPCLGQLIDVV